MKYKKASGLICSNLYSGKRTGGGPASSSCTLPSSCANCKHKNPDGENNILLSSKFVSKPQERVQEKQREIGLICLNNINEKVEGSIEWAKILERWRMVTLEACAKSRLIYHQVTSQLHPLLITQFIINFTLWLVDCFTWRITRIVTYKGQISMYLDLSFVCWIVECHYSCNFFRWNNRLGICTQMRYLWRGW